MKNRKNAIASSISALLGAPPVPVRPGFTAGKPPYTALEPNPIDQAVVDVLRSAAPAPPPAPPVEPSAPPEALHPPVKLPPGARLERAEIARIRPNPRQPRQTFNPDTLEELSASIKRHGVLQPLIVRAAAPGDYTLLAGERRLRAASLAGLKEVPVLVVDASELQLLELSIVENVQRDDLNPVEEAAAYRKLIDDFGWTQEEIADRVGKRRSTVANSLRLLTLPEEMIDDVRAGRLTAGHARAILQVPDTTSRSLLRKEILTSGLSVRLAEQRAQDLSQPRRTLDSLRKREPKKADEDVDIVHLRDRLVETLGCPVRIRPRNTKSGVIELNYQTLDDLDRFLNLLNIDR